MLHPAAGHAPAPLRPVPGRAGRGAAGRGRRPPHRPRRPGLTCRRAVDDDGAGHQPEGLEEVLGVAIAREGEAVDAEAPLLTAPLDERLHHRLADAELPRARVGVEVGDDAEPTAVGEHLDAGDAVAHHHVVDGADQHVVVGVGDLRRAARARRAAAGRRAAPTPRRRGPAAARRSPAPASSASRGRSSSVAGRVPSSGAARPSATLELGDLRQDRLAAAVGRLVQLHVLELRRREAGQAVHDLRRGEPVVVGDGAGSPR